MEKTISNQKVALCGKVYFQTLHLQHVLNMKYCK